MCVCVCVCVHVCVCAQEINNDACWLIVTSLKVLTYLEAVCMSILAAVCPFVLLHHSGEHITLICLAAFLHVCTVHHVCTCHWFSLLSLSLPLPPPLPSLSFRTYLEDELEKARTNKVLRQVYTVLLCIYMYVYVLCMCKVST